MPLGQPRPSPPASLAQLITSPPPCPGPSCRPAAGFHRAFTRWAKPFNPILGETWQACAADGSRIFLEQVGAARLGGCVLRSQPVLGGRGWHGGGEQRRPSRALLWRLGLSGGAVAAAAAAAMCSNPHCHCAAAPCAAKQISHHPPISAFQLLGPHGLYTFCGQRCAAAAAAARCRLRLSARSCKHGNRAWIGTRCLLPLPCAACSPCSQPSVSYKTNAVKTTARGYRAVDFADGGRVQIHFPAYHLRGGCRLAELHLHKNGAALCGCEAGAGGVPRRAPSPPARPCRRPAVHVRAARRADWHSRVHRCGQRPASGGYVWAGGGRTCRRAAAARRLQWRHLHAAATAWRGAAAAG